PAAIQEVGSESWPVVRDPEELHDALLTLILTPASAEWARFFGDLEATGRATSFDVDGMKFWTPAERVDTLRLVHPTVRISPEIPSFERTPPEDRQAAAVEIVRGWLESTGPTTARGLASRLALPA